jgi:alkanesulfonate monooxygenase SsuD/methylene tetrahydromethanopterin reductase-like flavin-dependent oxidoreductase (luciferase family)
MAAERLGLALLPGALGSSPDCLLSLACEAEEAGFDAVFVPEAGADALALAQLLLDATRRTTVGTWIANIYLRHPVVCAAAAALFGNRSGGRFLLGLGVGHRPLNEALDIAALHPIRDMRRYVRHVRATLRDEGPAPLAYPATHPVPIYLAALGLAMVECAGEIADGLLCHLCPLEHVAAVRHAIRWGADRAKRRNVPELALGLPTFLAEDLDPARAAAREQLAAYAGLAAYRQLFREASFQAEAEAMERGDVLRGLTDRLLDAVCLLGPPAACRDRLVALREAGVTLPILLPGGRDHAAAARATITTFGAQR